MFETKEKAELRWHPHFGLPMRMGRTRDVGLGRDDAESVWGVMNWGYSG
jgi:hypothetical protein